jgi:hypothetical protein
MKVKSIALFLIILFGGAWNVSAQKIKSETVDSAVPHYPFIPLPDSFVSYRVNFLNQGLDLKEFTNIVNPAEKIQLQKFKRVTDPADLNIVITIGKVNLYQAYTTTKINSLDELKGLSTEAMIDFYAEVGFEITDNKGIIIQKEFQGAPGEFAADAVAKPVQSKAVDIVKNVTDYVNKSVAAAANRIRDLVDVYQEKHPIDFYIIKPSKTETYAEFSAAVQKLNDAFKTKSSESIQNALHEAVGFWEAKMNSFDPKTEEGKPHYFLCTYNLSIAYCLLDDFGKSSECLEKTKSTDYKPGFTSMITYDIEHIKKHKLAYLAEKDKCSKDPGYIYQRGVRQKSSSFISGSGKTDDTPFMEKGFIVLSGSDTLFGNFLDFDVNMTNGKILFVENGKAKKDYSQPFDNIQNLSLRGAVYYYKSGLRKVTYSSPALVVLSNNVESLFIFIKQSKGAMYTLFDAGDGASYVTNYKKKLADVFKGICPAVEQKALQGEYDLKQSGTKSIEQPIKDYESQCGSKEYEKNAAILDEKALMRRYK